MPLVSIIIPVFNAECHIKECLDAVMRQTLRDVEVILIDDASVDESVKILESLQHMRENVRIVCHQDNIGAAGSRNEGLMMAKGDYVAFCDSDDIVDADMYELLYRAALKNDADIVMCGIARSEGGGRVFMPPQAANCGTEVLCACVPSIVFNSPCNKLYRRAFLERNNLSFDPKLKTTEDLLFNVKAFLATSSVYMMDFAPYHYRMNKSSVTHNRDVASAWSVVSSAYQAGRLLSDAKYFPVRDRLYRDAILAAVKHNLLSAEKLAEIKCMVVGDIRDDVRHGFAKKLILSMPAWAQKFIATLFARIEELKGVL